MFDYGYHTIGAYGSVNLYSDRCLGVSPECRNPEMLLYPFEEQLDLPSIPVKEYDLFGGKIKVVGIEYKTSFEIRNVGNDPPNIRRIIGGVSGTDEAHCLILEDVPLFRHVFTVLHPVFGMGLLPYYEEGIEFIDSVKTRQVPVTPVKYVAGQRFIINGIHCIDIMDRCICYVDHDRNSGHNVKLGMKFYAGLGASESGPVIDTHTEVYCGRIESIEFAADTEFAVDPGFLGQRNHMIGEILEYMPVPMGVASGKNVSIHGFTAKSKVKGFLAMGSGYVVSSRRLRLPISCPNISTSN